MGHLLTLVGHGLVVVLVVDLVVVDVASYPLEGEAGIAADQTWIARTSQPGDQIEEPVGQTVRVAPEGDCAEAEDHEEEACDLRVVGLSNGQVHQEPAADEAAGHRGDTEDDGGKQQEKALEELEVARADRAAKAGEERASQACDEGGEGEEPDAEPAVVEAERSRRGLA